MNWEASPAGDVIADSVVALLMHAQSSAVSIRLTSKPCRHAVREGEEQAAKKVKTESVDSESKTDDEPENSANARLRLIYVTLKGQYQNVEATYEGHLATYEIVTDCGLESDVLDEDGKLSCSITVDFTEMSTTAKITVECKDAKLAANVQDCIRNLADATVPISV